MTLFGKLKGLFGSDSEKEQPKEIALRTGTAEYHYFVAAGELDHGENLVHGMSHLAELLVFDPGRGEWLELLERYLGRQGPEELLPEEEERYFATEAVRAFVLARQGDLKQAVELLLEVNQAKPATRYLEAWVLGWLEPEGAFESLPQTVAQLVLAAALGAYPEHRVLTVQRQRALKRFAALAKRYARHFPASEAIDMMIAGLYRKAGLFDEGLRYARAASAQRPSWHNAVAEGLILRERGETDAAREAFGQALVHDPDDLAARLEAGDMYFNLEDWERARSWYEQALAIESRHPWAYPSALWCTWRTESDAPFPDEAFPDELVILARDEGNGRAGSLLSRFFPYVGYLPQPADASANVLRQVMEEYRGQEPGDGVGELKLTLSDVEAPSNAIAFRLGLRSIGVEGELVVSYENVASPDPREPVEPVPYSLWRREGDRLVPALPPPPEQVTVLIAEIAALPYDPQQGWARASRVAEQLGRDPAEQVLACMVHPPEVPAGIDVLEWIPRVQLAAAEVIAHLDDGWEDSVRRAALLSLVLGPRDWTTQAAILAISHLVRDHEVIAPDVHEAFTKLQEARPDSGHACYEHALYSCWVDFPHLFPDERDELQATLAELEEEDEDEELDEE